MSRTTNMLSLVRFYTPNREFGRAARRRLQAQYPDRASSIWRSARAWQARLAPDRPRHSPGVNLNVRYAEWSCALYRAAQEHGVDRAEAAELVEKTLRDFYGPVTAALFELSRLRSAARKTRVRWLLDIMIRTFFTAPFEYRRFPYEAGVAFDVVRCPIAEYFEARGVPELARHYCTTDYVMAREWGMELNRSQTIATGADHCDFRFKVVQP
jgi:ubiquinone biosynthesis protein